LQPGDISLFATGEGQRMPAGVDGGIRVSAAVGVQYAGAAPNEVAGMIQVNVQIPIGVEPGGCVPVVLQIGGASTIAGAVWIAVAGN
jgi:uncharacterized protein (TIGR03437 family)